MGVIIGVEFDNWRLEMRRRGLGPREQLDYVLAQVVVFGRSFDIRPVGLDLGIGVLPSDPVALKELRARLVEDQIVPMVYGRSLFLTPHPEEQAEQVHEACRQLEVMAALGIRVAEFDCHLNGRLTREGNIQTAIRMLRDLGQAARSLGIAICQENYDTFTSAELVRICAETGLDNVGLNVDTGNWLVLGEDPVKATARCTPYVIHAHVRDYHLTDHYFRSVPLGQGQVGLERVLPHLLAAARQRSIVWTLELDPADLDLAPALAASCQYLRVWLARSG